MKIGEVKNYINPKGRYSFHPPSSIMVKKKFSMKLDITTKIIFQLKTVKFF